MANEYVVNEADLVSVADAIREKSGSSEELVFPDGFRDAISSISTSSGDSENIAYGTVTMSGTIVLKNNPMVVTGLGFAPTSVMIWVSKPVTIESTTTWLVFSSIGDAFGTRDLATYRYHSSEIVSKLYTSTEGIYFPITLQDDGFTMTATESNYCRPSGASLNYVAVG